MCRLLFLLCFLPFIIAQRDIDEDDDEFTLEFFCGVMDPYNTYNSRLVRVDPKENMAIDGAGIVNIRRSVFKNCGGTLILTMAGNRLNTMTGQRLEGLRNLTMLSFFDNVIDNITDGTFDGLPYLSDLELSYNRLNGLGTGVRSGLKELRKLHLNHNPIELREDGFSGLTKLELLELTGANIFTIPSGSFNGLDNLWRLDLSSNKLTNISEPSFRALIRLEELDLSMNQISTISEETFEGLTNLKVLSLNENKIWSLINNDIFEPIPYLNYLYFHNNPLALVDVAVFKDMQQVVIEPGFIMDFSGAVKNNFFNVTSTLYHCSRLYNSAGSEDSHAERIPENSDDATSSLPDDMGLNYFSPRYCSLMVLFDHVDPIVRRL